MNDDDINKLRDQITDLLDEREALEILLGDAEDYLQHKSTCARLLTKRDCDCGLVELQTRVHAELDHDKDDDDDEDDQDDDE